MYSLKLVTHSAAVSFMRLLVLLPGCWSKSGAVAGQKLVLLLVKTWCCCWSKSGAGQKLRCCCYTLW